MTAAPHHPAASRLTDLPRPPWLPDGDWPFPTSALELDDGTRIAVTSVGRGPTVLFVHTGLWSFVWRDVIARLAADHRCVCFDAPGTGRSDRLPVAAINLERAARALVAVVRALDIADVTLVLHDLGGPSGLAGAARVADRIRALCAVNTFGWRPDGVLFRSVLALMGTPAVRELSAWSGILTRVTSTAFGVGRHLEARGRRAFRAGADAQALRAFHAYLRDAGRARALYQEVDRALGGPFRRLPLVTIFGEHNDPFGFQARWHALYPDARQVVVRNGNHFPMCDDPDLVARSIRQLHTTSR